MTLKARITAIDRFIKGCREDGIYDDLNACCVMAGWDSLAGALTPLKGAAPTNSGFLDADLDRGIGLTGNGSSKYLNSNRANNAESQNDKSLAAYISSLSTSSGSNRWSIGDDGTSVLGQGPADKHYGRINDAYTSFPGSDSPESGFVGVNRSDSATKTLRLGGTDYSIAAASATPSTANLFIFRRNEPGIPGYSDATLAFYSIGSATDLALLDARVSTLMADLRAIEEAGFDRDAIAYIRAVEEADGGAYLETDVKVAINNLVAGLKADGLWDAIGASCLLSGPRTLAGALVPLKGDAPTNVANGFVGGDYDRLGLLGDGTSHLDTGYAIASENQDNCHFAVYGSSLNVGGFAGTDTAVANERLLIYSDATQTIVSINNGNQVLSGAGSTATGFIGGSRGSAGGYFARTKGVTYASSQTSKPVSGTSVYLYGVNRSDSLQGGFAYAADLSFYSIGADIGSDGLAKLDTHVSAYVTAIGAAI